MNSGQVDSEVEVNAELMLKSTFKLGDHDPVDVEFVSAWISEIADVRNLKSLKNKAVAYAKKLVESECLETKHQLAEMTERYLTDMNFPTGHAKAISQMVVCRDNKPPSSRPSQEKAHARHLTGGL